MKGVCYEKQGNRQFVKYEHIDIPDDNDEAAVSEPD